MLKKAISLMLALLCLVTVFAGCDKGGNSGSQSQPGSDTGSTPDGPTVQLAPTDPLMEYTEYTLDAYLKPLWYTREIYNETLMFIGEDDCAPLMYDATEIISVRNYGLNKEYAEGVDWTYENGIFCRTENSAIPCWDPELYYLPYPGTYSIPVDKSKIGIELEGDRYLRYGELDTFTSYQIAVTYKHDSPWQGPIPADKSARFDKTIAKLKSGEKTKIVLFGDSISTGCNASGTPAGGKVSPYMPSFDSMVASFLTNEYNANVEVVNNSKGGMDVYWARSNIVEKVVDEQPDLAIIAFGMNDGSKSVESFIGAIKDIINTINYNLPDTEIMLIGTMLPNYEAGGGWYGNQQYFAAAQIELEDEYDYVSVANVTEMHDAMFKAGKRYRDVTANNINHPNDFVVRLYAQVILKTLAGKDYCNERWAKA